MISITPLSGYKFITDFTVSLNPSANDVIIGWGDGSISTSSSATHTYSSANIYEIYVGTCGATSAFNISVFNGDFYENKLEIQYQSLSAYASCLNTFQIGVSSTTPNSTIFLYSSGSNSIPYNTERGFWSHLNPEWRFINAQGDAIAELSITGTPVYLGNNILGYSALSTVQYADDMPGNPILFFTMVREECDELINSRVFAGVRTSISAERPLGLKITADGINPINETQWADTSIPYVVSVYGNCTNIMHYASGNIIGNRILGSCNSVDPQSFTFNLSPINLRDEDCFNVGGYSINSFSLPSSAIPADSVQTNYDVSCGRNPSELEITAVRYSPLQMVLSASALIKVNNVNYTLTGVSDPFNIYRFENFHQFYRKGEETTVYDLIKRYSHFDLDALPIMDSYMNAIAGSGDTLGKVYDKIVNIPKDTADLDLCTIPFIHDHATQVDANIDDYNLEFPEELKRVMNMFSIPLQKLIGTRCVCNTNFNCSNCCGKNICGVCGFDKKSNVGNPLTFTDYVSAGQTILYRENGSEIYEFLPITNSTLVRDISANPVYDRGLTNFCFYQWDKSSQNNPVESVIDYKNPNTLISRSLSSQADFYEENGVVEEMLNFILTKNILES